MNKVANMINLFISGNIDFLSYIIYGSKITKIKLVHFTLLINAAIFSFSGYTIIKRIWVTPKLSQK
jgi:hypothetical protein